MTRTPSSVAELDFTPVGRVHPSPADWRDQVLYQLLIDRFDNNASDIPAYDPNNARRGRDPAKQAGVFQGGRLDGITRRLDYIKGLGCTTVWISPPFKQRISDPGSYHGYAVQDFLSIDPRFGTVRDLQRLSRECHKRGMYLVLDIVINHTGDVFEYAQEPTPYLKEGRYDFKQWRKIGESRRITRDDAVWPIELQHPDAFKRKGAIRDLGIADMDEVINGDFLTLKELDMGNPVVLDALIRIYKYWIAIADVDGYRIDTVKHVEPEFCARFCNAIREYAERIGKRDFFLFGEIVADDELLHKYVGNNGPAAGTDEWYPRLDAALDFPLYHCLDEVIKGQGNCQQLRDRYEHFRHYYRNQGEAAAYYVTFIDNHDQMHRPYRRFLNGITDPRIGIAGIAYLLCNLGIPCIYYGTEQGFDGGGDVDHYVREAMFGGQWGAFDTTGVHFFNSDHPIYRGVASIAAVRAQQKALRYGRQYFRDISGDGQNFGPPTHGQCTLAFSRVLDTDEVLVLLNLRDTPAKDWVIVDGNISRHGMQMHDLLIPGQTFNVELRADKPAVQVPMEPRQVRMLKV